MKKLYGFVLCAGFGKRLLPLTKYIPKPLLELCGKSVLDLAIEKLIDAGVEKIGVNGHYLSDQLKAHIEKSKFCDRIVFFHENDILDTGGGLVNARKFLCEADSFIVHNGDIASDCDVKALVKYDIENESVATLYTVDANEKRVLVDDAGCVLDMRGVLNVEPPEKSTLTTFSGIAVYSRKIFDYLPSEPQFVSVVDALLKCISSTEKGTVKAFHAPCTAFWSDIGTLGQYFEAHKLMGTSFRGNLMLGDGFVSCSSDAIVEEGAYLSNCIVLSGAHITKDAHFSNAVIGNGFSCHRDSSELEAISIIDHTLDVTSLAEQGSARRFYRIGTQSDNSSALMISYEGDPDFERFVKLGRFFSEHSLYTPEIYAVEPEKRAVTMEFLGFRTLNDALVKAVSDDEKISYYIAAADALSDFQMRGTKIINENRNNVEIRDFDYDYLRWETSYFKENLLERFCGIVLENDVADALEGEFHVLAQKCLDMEQTLMHRDFQSQNIMLHNDRVRFVDFQGARIGSYLYDIMSLLRDPYFPVDASTRRILMDHHRMRLAGYGLEISPEQYEQDALAASLQRTMQCLGAYGFLWLVKGKTKYASFIAPALELLMESLEKITYMPVLSKLLLSKVADALEKNKKNSTLSCK